MSGYDLAILKVDLFGASTPSEANEITERNVLRKEYCMEKYFSSSNQTSGIKCYYRKKDFIEFAEKNNSVIFLNGFENNTRKSRGSFAKNTLQYTRSTKKDFIIELREFAKSIQ